MFLSCMFNKIFSGEEMVRKFQMICVGMVLVGNVGAADQSDVSQILDAGHILQAQAGLLTAITDGFDAANQGANNSQAALTTAITNNTTTVNEHTTTQINNAVQQFTTNFNSSMDTIKDQNKALQSQITWTQRVGGIGLGLLGYKAYSSEIHAGANWIKQTFTSAMGYDSRAGTKAVTGIKRGAVSTGSLSTSTLNWFGRNTLGRLPGSTKAADFLQHHRTGALNTGTLLGAGLLLDACSRAQGETLWQNLKNGVTSCEGIAGATLAVGCGAKRAGADDLGNVVLVGGTLAAITKAAVHNYPGAKNYVTTWWNKKS